LYRFRKVDPNPGYAFQSCSKLPRQRRTAAAFEAVQDSLEKERLTADATIQAFPTSSFAESNFPSGAAGEFRAKHESEAADAGTIAAAAVEVARAASETALNQAKHSDHQLDKWIRVGPK
jgi:hypothetical protein